MNAHNYREDRTSAELDRLLHHDFFIPISRGITAKFVEENYPGWTWNQLIRVLSAAGVRTARPGRSSVCRDGVVRVQFDSESSWRVEWKDGSVTEGPQPSGTTQPAPSAAIETGVHDLSTGMVIELPGTPEAITGESTRLAPESAGWPADERPIFIDAGHGHVQPSAPVYDGLGEPRQLTEGVILNVDSGIEEFARAWTETLAEKPTDAERWEYSVEVPQPEEDPYTSGPLPISEALERVRATPGARLRRRAVSSWRIVHTPFPTIAKAGWAELEPVKREWHAALNEFPPSYRGSVSRMGGVDAAPSAWIEFARRAAAVGFSPLNYRMLGTARLAWDNRQAKLTALRPREVPGLEAIEFWARFPQLLADGLSPFEAIERIIRTQ